MENYHHFLKYYDSIVRWINSPLDEEVEFLHTIIQKYIPWNTSKIHVLETACWTWVVAKEFIKLGYPILWLDINPYMIEEAKKNISSEHLVLWDMTNFSLEQKFNVILCNYNSICHLLEWQEWRNFFKMASLHLQENGLLIFDINTLFEFENITREFAQFYTFGENTVCLDMTKKINHYEWKVQIFEQKENNNYHRFVEYIPENSFPIHMIKKELKEHGFSIPEILDFHTGTVHAESERVYFICKKIKHVP